MQKILKKHKIDIEDQNKINYENNKVDFELDDIENEQTKEKTAFKAENNYENPSKYFLFYFFNKNFFKSEIECFKYKNK